MLTCQFATRAVLV